MLPIYLFVGLFALLANCTPSTLWRSDKKGPDVIKKAGGFKTKAHMSNSKDVCSLTDHQSDPPSNDAFISTSSSKDVSVHFLHRIPDIGSGWLYEIDPSKAGVKFHDCVKETGLHKDELEFAAEGNIPVDAIIACTQYTNGKPGKRITGCRPPPPPKKISRDYVA